LQTNAARRDFVAGGFDLRLEENWRGAAVERGNQARTEKMAGAGRLLEVQIERKDRCGASGHAVSQLLETDALAAQVGMGELFLRRRRLAGVADAVRKRSLLRGEQ